MGGERTVVYVVDDEPEIRQMIVATLKSSGLDADIEVFGSAEEFLATWGNPPARARCLLLDADLPGLSGLDLQEKLAADGIYLPILFVTSSGSVAMAVQAMKRGAIDILEKPFSREVLYDKVRAALENDTKLQPLRAQRAEVMARAALLSPREREVMELLFAAKGTKEIATALGISQKTVAKHRIQLLEKLQVDSVVELVRLGRVQSN